jgi:hypothetical protein
VIRRMLADNEFKPTPKRRKPQEPTGPAASVWAPTAGRRKFSGRLGNDFREELT